MRRVTSFAIINLILLSYTLNCYSQINLYGKVIDSRNREPLIFCNISFVQERNGTITNEHGKFSINVNNVEDTLIASFIGYKPAFIPVIDIIDEIVIELTPLDYALNEVIILEEDILYKYINECRKNLNNNFSEQHSKAYIKVNSEFDGNLIELLESYYNAEIYGPKVRYLDYKSGRAVIDTTNGNLWKSLNTAKALLKIDLLSESEFFPRSPLNYKSNKIKKRYYLHLDYSDENILKISFTPKKQERLFFSGVIFVTKSSYHLVRIDLHIKNTQYHPLEPISYCDSMNSVDVTIVNVYDTIDNKSRLKYSCLDYSLHYYSVKDSTCPYIKRYVLPQNYKKIDYHVSSKSMIYLYDYSKSFLIPYFDYPKDERRGDYFPISVIPYNKEFWNNNNPSFLDNNEIEILSNENDTLFNLSNSYKGVSYLNTVNNFQAYYKNRDYNYWNDSTRIIINGGKKSKYKRYITDFNINSRPIQQYKICTQILLDINKIGDSIKTISYTVFEGYKSKFYFVEDENTDIFINMYFDICEIERREMQKKLDSNNLTREVINTIYQETQVSMKRICNQYLKEVDRGRNLSYVKVWNDYIVEKLGINNLYMFTHANKYNHWTDQNK